MKIPESVRIAGIEYRIESVDYLNDGTTLAYGYIDYEKHVIQFNKTEDVDHQHKCVTLLHEILHGIRQNNGMKITNEEQVVDMYARGLYQVLQDNGRRLFDIGGAHMEWINAKTQLPATDDEVLVVTQSKNGTRNIDKGRYMVNEKYWVHRGSAEVTYWAPMPELPEEES